jgi:peroxiredoxin
LPNVTTHVHATTTGCPSAPGKFSDRQTFLIDDKGTVVGHWLERDGSMANVKTPAHTDQILAAIDKL